MEIWYQPLKALLVDEWDNLQVFVGLYLAFGVLEFLAPADGHQGWRGRLRNLAYTVIYLLGGMLVLVVVVLALSQQPPDLPDRGPLISAWYVLLYLLAMTSSSAPTGHLRPMSFRPRERTT